ncbi:hypothetical protein AB0B66_11920 [Catellatospora sp. NPDC049111]|uniref:hypothetical protein n=1 Tax=Catellatospora sp. NPDC049111 TaxID=3155271 RepID=UPI0033FD5AC0
MGLFGRRKDFVPLTTPRPGLMRMTDFAWLNKGGRERIEQVLELVKLSGESAAATIEAEPEAPDLNLFIASLTVIAVSELVEPPEEAAGLLLFYAHLGRVLSAVEKEWRVPDGSTHMAIHTALAFHRTQMPDSVPAELRASLGLAMEVAYYCDRAGDHPYRVLGVQPHVI